MCVCAELLTGAELRQPGGRQGRHEPHALGSPGPGDLGLCAIRVPLRISAFLLPHPHAHLLRLAIPQCVFSCCRTRIVAHHTSCRVGACCAGLTVCAQTVQAHGLVRAIGPLRLRRQGFQQQLRSRARGQRCCLHVNAHMMPALMTSCVREKDAAVHKRTIMCSDERLMSAHACGDDCALLVSSHMVYIIFFTCNW